MILVINVITSIFTDLNGVFKCLYGGKVGGEGLDAKKKLGITNLIFKVFSYYEIMSWLF